MEIQAHQDDVVNSDNQFVTYLNTIINSIPKEFLDNISSNTVNVDELIRICLYMFSKRVNVEGIKIIQAENPIEIIDIFKVYHKRGEYKDSSFTKSKKKPFDRDRIFKNDIDTHTMLQSGIIVNTRKKNDKDEDDDDYYESSDSSDSDDEGDKIKILRGGKKSSVRDDVDDDNSSTDTDYTDDQDQDSKSDDDEDDGVILGRKSKKYGESSIEATIKYTKERRKKKSTNRIKTHFDFGSDDENGDDSLFDLIYVFDLNKFIKYLKETPYDFKITKHIKNHTDNQTTESKTTRGDYIPEKRMRTKTFKYSDLVKIESKNYYKSADDIPYIDGNFGIHTKITDSQAKVYMRAPTLLRYIYPLYALVDHLAYHHFRILIKGDADFDHQNAGEVLMNNEGHRQMFIHQMITTHKNSDVGALLKRGVKFI